MGSLCIVQRWLCDTTLSDASIDKKAEVYSVPTVQDQVIDEAAFQRAWQVTHQNTKDDWLTWLSNLRVQVLRQSPSSALRATAPLAEADVNIGKDFFNAGFLSCWAKLSDPHRNSLMHTFETIMGAVQVPSEITMTLLDLVEYMDHREVRFILDPRALGDSALSTLAYAKALHYKEVEFNADPSSDCLEQIIRISVMLQQPLMANGIVEYSKRVDYLELQGSWYEPLKRWDDAIAQYCKREQESPGNQAIVSGLMRCYNAFGEWHPLYQLAEKYRDLNLYEDLPSLGAMASWGLGKWPKIQVFLELMEENSLDRRYFEAILAVHEERYEDAQRVIDMSHRLSLEQNIAGDLKQSYVHAYK